MLLEELRTRHDVDVVDLSPDSRHDGGVTARRLAAVGRILRKVWLARSKADAVYLTISESLAGNLKDVCIYLMCASRLSNIYIHLHGGSLRSLLLDRHSTLLRVNTMFVKRLAGVIVSGRSHVGIFDGMINRPRIHIVPNFAQAQLFVPRHEIQAKFSTVDPLRILYMSAMTTLKGFNDLADACLLLPTAVQQRVQIDFAGKFDSDTARARFERKIAGARRISYHGVVDDATKQRLFKQAHVFCLPTAHLEGQPISILEAYASGCVVVTTVPSGIRDIFTPLAQGFEVQPRDPGSIRDVIEQLLADPERLSRMALGNRELAQTHYTTSRYQAALRGILEGRSSEDGD